MLLESLKIRGDQKRRHQELKLVNSVKERQRDWTSYLRLCSCVVYLKRREAPLTDILLAVRMRSTLEQHDLRTLPTEQQVFLGNSPVNRSWKSRSCSRDTSCCSSSLDLTEMEEHTLWKNSGPQLKHSEDGKMRENGRIIC